MKITVAGVGYVGLSLAVLLAQNHEVTAITTTPAKAEKLNKFISPIQDDEIERFFAGNYKENYKPKLTIFNVNKRTNLKFFEKLEKNNYKSLPLGTCIDEDVITPDVFEFYLQCPEDERLVHFLCLYNNNDELTINDFE